MRSLTNNVSCHVMLAVPQVFTQRTVVHFSFYMSVTPCFYSVCLIAFLNLRSAYDAAVDPRLFSHDLIRPPIVKGLDTPDLQQQYRAKEGKLDELKKDDKEIK